VRSLSGGIRFSRSFYQPEQESVVLRHHNYLYFRKVYYPYSESLSVYSYLDDPEFYDTYFIDDDSVIGYFRCNGYYCIMFRDKSAAHFVDKLYYYTGKERSFLRRPFDIDDWSEPQIHEFYEYQNGKFTRP